MTDYISREMTIDAICRLCNANFEEDPCEPSECEMMSLLCKIPAADVRPVEWIPVTERLPLYGQDVLAVRTYGDGEKCQEVLMAHIAVWNEETGKKWWNATNITHWMPLPSTEGLNET